MAGDVVVRDGVVEDRVVGDVVVVIGGRGVVFGDVVVIDGVI